MRPHVVPVFAGAAAGVEEPFKLGARRVRERPVFDGAEIHLQAVRRGRRDALARLRQLGAEHAAAVDDPVAGDDLHQLVLVAQAVHKQDEHRLRTDAGRRALERRVQLRGLRHEDDDIHDPDVVGRVRGLEARELMGLAAVYGEGKPVCGYFVHVLLIGVHQRQIGAAEPQISRRLAWCS